MYDLDARAQSGDERTRSHTTKVLWPFSRRPRFNL